MKQPRKVYLYNSIEGKFIKEYPSIKAASFETGILPNVIGNIMNGKQYVLVRSLDEGQEYNRRRTYRLPLDIKGSVLGIGDVIIHDISNTGIAFYLDKGKKCDIGQTVSIGFSARNKNYVVSATIARIVEEEKRCLYGCTMMSNPVIDGFINEEQRFRIKGY